MNRSVWSWGVPVLLVTASMLAGARYAGQRSLSEVLAGLDSAYTSITEVSLDDGVWEIEALQDGRPIELHLDPQSGRVISRRDDGPHDALPKGAMPLVSLLRKLESAGYDPIREIDLDGAHWEVEALRDGVSRELTIDARTGEVLSDRLDD